MGFDKHGKLEPAPTRRNIARKGHTIHDVADRLITVHGGGKKLPVARNR